MGIACLSCGFDNPEGMKFCIQCASPLSIHCLKCRFDNPPGAVFCGQCGTALSPRSPERRQLTVLACNLAEAASLSEQLDPEELQQTIHAYHDRCVEVIRRFEGHVGQYLGDGLLVYFGYPAAHEDDAHRAVRAGLAIVHEIQALSSRLQQPMRVRIGVHTGQVVASHMGRNPLSIVGGTPHIAARLQDTAEPNTVRISAETHELVQSYFSCRDLGVRPLKGIAAKVHTHQVLGEGTAKSRFEVSVQTGLTPLVGREEQVALLLDCWQQVKAGQGRAVFISGEPGIGKSRLVHAFKERVMGESYTRISYHCSPYNRHSALYPAIDYLQRLIAFNRDDSDRDNLDTLERLFERYDFPLPENVPLLAAMLSLSVPEERYPSLSLSPERQKQKTQEVLLGLLLRAAEQQPVCTTVEDLHWADPSTLGLLGQLIARVPNARLLLLLTSRTELEPPWGSPPQLTQVRLNRLLPDQTQKLVSLIPGGEVLETHVVQQVVDRSDGNPLFVEELTKMVLESASQQRGEEAAEVEERETAFLIPRSLQDLLTARLDKLGPAKETAQLGAVLGKEFSYELIKTASDIDEVVLQNDLRRLGEAEVLRKEDHIPQARYFFRHALIQEAAYQSLLTAKRQQHHEHIAQTLKEQFPHIVEAQPELLASHLMEAGAVEAAIHYWQQAGQQALERSAYIEAIRHLNQGLDLLAPLPKTPENSQQELLLKATLGPALIATKGFAAPEVEQTYGKARELCDQLGRSSQLFPILRGLLAFYSVRAEHQTTYKLGMQSLQLADEQHAPLLLLGAHFELGASLFCMGKFAQALEHLQKSFTFYDPQERTAHLALYGQDLGVSCLARTAQVLWFLGYPDQALKKNQEALNLSREQEHPFTLAYALSFAVECHRLRREAGVAQEQAESVIALSKEHGFPIWIAGATILRGWALALQERSEEGIGHMRQGLSAWQITGAEVGKPSWLSLLAEAQWATGHIDEAWTLLVEAFSAIGGSEERYWEAELYRLRGELLLDSEKRGQHTKETDRQRGEAEQSFQHALDIARRQQAKSLELRAAMSLSRLWQAQHETQAARTLLAKVYGWFTEGFDTTDLKEAKRLLESLS